jgi:hypothetical protein
VHQIVIEVCLSEKVIGSDTHTRVSENRCECSQLKNLCCGKHEKRILTEVGRYAGDAIRDNFTSHPSFSVLKSSDPLTIMSRTF